jgi:O-acetylserine/cysteine efflux transporter
VAPFNLLVPLVAVICGVAIMGDQLTVTKVIGGAMILGGVALITVRQIVVSRRAKVTPSTPGAPL